MVIMIRAYDELLQDAILYSELFQIIFYWEFGFQIEEEISICEQEFQLSVQEKDSSNHVWTEARGRFEQLQQQVDINQLAEIMAKEGVSGDSADRILLMQIQWWNWPEHHLFKPEVMALLMGSNVNGLWEYFQGWSPCFS